MSQQGEVFVCGYGFGGRLGTNDEKAVIPPTLITFKNCESKCISVAAAADHTLFVMEDGKVIFYTVQETEFKNFVKVFKIIKLSLYCRFLAVE